MVFFEPFDRALEEGDGMVSGSFVDAAGDESEAAVAFDGFAGDAPAVGELVYREHIGGEVFGGEFGGAGEVLGEGGEVGQEIGGGDELGVLDVGSVVGDAEDDEVLGVEPVLFDEGGELFDAGEVAEEGWFPGEGEFGGEGAEGGGVDFGERGHWGSVWAWDYSVDASLVCHSCALVS